MNKPSFEDPALVALRCITQAHRVLEDVVTSSESFDYRKAKKGLKDLQKLIRELGREEARLRAGLVYNATASAQVVPFPTGQRETVNPR